MGSLIRGPVYRLCVLPGHRGAGVKEALLRCADGYHAQGLPVRIKTAKQDVAESFNKCPLLAYEGFRDPRKAGVSKRRERKAVVVVDDLSGGGGGGGNGGGGGGVDGGSGGGDGGGGGGGCGGDGGGGAGRSRFGEEEDDDRDYEAWRGNNENNGAHTGGGGADHGGVGEYGVGGGEPAAAEDVAQALAKVQERARARSQGGAVTGGGSGAGGVEEAVAKVKAALNRIAPDTLDKGIESIRTALSFAAINPVFAAAFAADAAAAADSQPLQAGRCSKKSVFASTA